MPLSGWDGRMFSIANGTHSGKRFLNTIGLTQSVMKTSLRQTSLFTEEISTSSAVDSLAKPSQPQDQEKERQTPDTFGPKCSVLYEKFAPVGLWEKTFMDLLIGTGDWFSTRCALTWKMKASKSSRLFCQLQVSTHRTKGIESSLLLTPGLVNIEESPQKYMERQRKRTDAGMNKAPHPGNKYNCLLSQVIHSGVFNNHGRVSQLNIHFVGEMMGFPPNWTELPFQSGATNP